MERLKGTLKQHFGDVITVYRWERRTGPLEGRQTVSYTLNPDVALDIANIDYKEQYEPSQEDIRRVEQDFNANGEAFFENYHYTKDFYNPSDRSQYVIMVNNEYDYRFYRRAFKGVS